MPRSTLPGSSACSCAAGGRASMQRPARPSDRRSRAWTISRNGALSPSRRPTGSSERASDSAGSGEVAAGELAERPADRGERHAGEQREPGHVRRPGQDLARGEVMEQRVRLQALGIGPERAEDLEEVGDDDDRDRHADRRPEAVERDRRRKADCRDRPPHQQAVEPQQREPLGGQLAEQARCGRPDDRPRDRRRQDDPDEQDDADEQRGVERPAGERPGEDDLERPALPLAGDRRRRQADREDRHQDDRDRVDVAEGDRAAEAEDVAAAEARELLGDDARIDQRLHLRAERLVDHRQEGAPAEYRDGHDQELRPLRSPQVLEEGPAHATASPVSPVSPAEAAAVAGSPSSGSVSSSRPRNASSRWAGSIVRSTIECPASAARNGPTSPSSWQGSRPSAVRAMALTPGTPSSLGRSPSATRSSTFRFRRSSSLATSSRATSRPRRTIATRSQTRSTSDRTWDEKKIVRPASRRSSRMP